MSRLISGPRVLLSLAFLALVAWAALRGLPDGRLHVWFLDVGQGDAVLLQTPDGQQILVDGGPSPSALMDELGEVMPFWDRSIDLVVLTHPDADHANGLIPLFERYKVATVVDAIAPGDKAGAAWVAAVAAAAVTRETAARGMRLIASPAVLTVLNPSGADAWIGDGNNGSIVLRLDYGATSALLTGDAEAEAERSLLSSGQPLRADVLKVGHHGSNAATSSQFLAAVLPALAVISVGADNRFGHPAPELLHRLEEVKVLRTDDCGRVALKSDGRKWTAQCER